MNNISVYLNILRLKGYLAYEYNPFRNYLTDVDLYLVNNKYLVPKNMAVNLKNGDLLTNKGTSDSPKWVDKRGNIISNYVLSEDGDLYASAGSLIDLNTDKLNFDLEHPVDITVLPSYDGSVNLILNDNKNIPRLINSRFSVREKNTYEIVDRIGENDTNIYNSKTFDKDTSLYFLYEQNPTISFEGHIGGTLPVGQYCFYLTYCDADDNESDFIAETGVIPVFIGEDGNPFSMDGGIKNLSSNKGIKLRLFNLDKSYNYIKVYYVRYFADYLLNRVYECKKIYLKYAVNSSVLTLQITGNEECEDLDANILNLSRFNPKSILTLAQCKNMLFFGNIVKNTDNYKELLDCALRIIPEILIKTLETVDSDYYYSSSENAGYYNSKNMYNNTGYFDLEYYRFGVVFIYLNGTLSNVYNTLGGDLQIIKNKDKQDTPTITYKLNTLFDSGIVYLTRKYIKTDDNGWIKNSSEYFNSSSIFLNSKGVCRLNAGIQNDNQIIGINFNVPEEVSKFLKEDLGIRGLFFVRQKCVPNILALCYLLPYDEVLRGPILETVENKKSVYYTECFLDLRGGNSISSDNEILIDNTYSIRLHKYGSDSASYTPDEHAYVAICPDFLLNLPYYNQIFNGSDFKLLKISTESNLVRDGRYYRMSDNTEYNLNSSLNTVTICSVTDDVNSVALQDKIFKLEKGNADEVFRFEYAEKDTGTYDMGRTDKKGRLQYTPDLPLYPVNFVRGIYSPYLAIYSKSKLSTGCLYNIYLENTLNTELNFLIRMNSAEPFYAISDRYNFEKLTNGNSLLCWRGDCYLNTFTYRLNRNFNDSSLPNNDVIVDRKTWKSYYKDGRPSGDSKDWEDISRSDINAVQMGSWITIKVRSSMNYALRSEDHSYVSEEALMGSPRSYYPRKGMMWRGTHKMPDSYLYNDAYRATLGFKCYFTLQDLNYIKNTFSNRIQYSAISILDSFKNNYRYSLSTYFRDYSQEYGGITKLVEFDGNLLVIFEHAIGLAAINERILMNGDEGLPVFINTQNVLPEELTVITNTHGTQWPESVVKTESGAVYGVDTITKKIWRVAGRQFEILSDFKVGKFLIDNISLSERELSPIIGLRNVKTHYNNNKKDIMFTFYDNVYKDEEKVWNLCFNELLNEFVTFYSWVPSYSENIDTQFFTFNRDTSKELALLSKCNYSIPENVGILVDSPVLNDSDGIVLSNLIEIDHDFGSDTFFYDQKGYYNIKTGDMMPENYINQLSIEKLNEYVPILNDDCTYVILYYTKPTITNVKIMENDVSNLKYSTRYEYSDAKFKIEKDHWGNYKYFSISFLVTAIRKHQDFENDEIRIIGNAIHVIDKEGAEQAFELLKVLYLEITPIINGIDLPTETIALTLSSIVDNPNLTLLEKEKPHLTTDFYLHGQAGIFDIEESLHPCYWYGKTHPFEFEFVVNDKVGQLKLFNNLIILSNKAEPESFHFEIEGDNYEFSSDKRAMYFRLESTKALFQNLGSNVLFDRNYSDVSAELNTLELYYRGGDEYIYDKGMAYPVQETGLVLQIKSTIFPLYYERVDTYNDIYHNYTSMNGFDSYDFKNLSGSEIVWNRDLNLFNIVTHIKNLPIEYYGRLRGNSLYKLGIWNIQIPSIIFNLKNENKWNEYPPIIINSLNIPTDLTDSTISSDKIPNIYTRTDRTNGSNTSENSVPISEYIEVGDWTYRKEAQIRDKWMKVRIRYSGKNLAIIHSITTLYNLSYG